MESCRNIYLLERSKEKVTMNIIDQILDLTTKISAETTKLNKAQGIVVKITLAKVDAENLVETKTASLYAEGKVEGSNEATRKANLANLLATEMDAVKTAEYSLIKAKANVQVSENTIRAYRDSLYSLNTVLKVQSGISEG